MSRFNLTGVSSSSCQDGLVAVSLPIRRRCSSLPATVSAKKTMRCCRLWRHILGAWSGKSWNIISWGFPRAFLHTTNVRSSRAALSCGPFHKLTSNSKMQFQKNTDPSAGHTVAATQGCPTIQPPSKRLEGNSQGFQRFWAQSLFVTVQPFVQWHTNQFWHGEQNFYVFMDRANAAVNVQQCFSWSLRAVCQTNVWLEWQQFFLGQALALDHHHRPPPVGLFHLFNSSKLFDGKCGHEPGHSLIQGLHIIHQGLWQQRGYKWRGMSFLTRMFQNVISICFQLSSQTTYI